MAEVTSVMLNAKFFWERIAKPAFEAFKESRFDLSKAVAACILVHHSSEQAYAQRLGVSKSGKAQTAYWDSQTSQSFKAVRGVAVAAKHGSRKKDAYSLIEVYSRPPAVAGLMMCGLSVMGDSVGGVMASPEVGGGLQVDVYGALVDVIKDIAGDFPELAITLP